jgi:crotonobetainyl-CoA:carnitine CoA-transferase CaiB-like acyl-CoA transferase
MEGALKGVRVIEFANYVSGPYAGMLLGDLGADVIKVEEPERGDPFRGWGRVDYSPTFASVNRNKKSVTIDLKSPAGKADAIALASSADVVIENFRPGTLDRLGLGYSVFATSNPGLVWCSITGFGSDGPYAHRPGYDTVGQAMSGLLSLLTDPANPQPMGISLSDHLAGITACNGILAALVARARTGRGQRVDTSLLESAISFCGENMARYFDNGKVPFRATRTKQAQVYAFAAGDGKALVVHLSSPTKFWRGLCDVVGKPEWVEDPRFESKESRGKNYDALHEELSQVICTQPRAHWLAKLEAADVPCSALNTFDDVFDDPQVQHLGMRIETPHPKLGSISLVRNGLRMSDTPVLTHRGPPELGEHNDEVLPSRKDTTGSRS